ncbi:MAG: cobyrinate a,c-diamide synthase, partial [Deltaproteobacteria bacterium]|nr:cobyrinate a,c-diamide synthase [Deltaproteobacteria bacterium]
MNKPKGIVIAGLSGGSGKSVVSVGLTAVWKKAGKSIAPFKKGPDYIDAGWLQLAAGRDCYNLDPYLVSEDLILASFDQRGSGSDLVVVEGNRGLFDGVTAKGGFSTAELALTLELPILLVVNCTKTTRTVAAMVLGCMNFDERINLCGVIINHVATSRQSSIITEAVEYYTGVDVLGVMPRMKQDIFPMRHLGMIPHQEYEDCSSALEFLAKSARENIDIPKVEAIMTPGASPANDSIIDLMTVPAVRDVRIGILQDAAFQFYYPENMIALERQGVELVPINAIKDNELPDIDGLYIGGGFPETSARELSANERFRRSVRHAADSGMPLYAECGGLIYLASSIVLDDEEFPLADVFPIRFGMSSKPQAHGYSIFSSHKSNPFYPVGTRVKG